MRIVPEIPLSISEISYALGISTSECNISTVNAVCTDSRALEKNDLFVALKGDNVSGENFTAEAKKKGAYIISEKDENATFKVLDTHKALLDIASYYKSKFKGLRLTVAITGSVGKTTTKNTVSKMLSSCFKVHKTHENFNNILGVAYTLLTMPKDTEILVCELGMNHFFEISLLSKAISPDIAIITNIGTAHIGNLGTRENIARAKLEITDGMKNETVIVPFEEPLLYHPKNRLTFSLTDKKADCYIESETESTEYSTVNIYTKRNTLKSKKIKIPGRHALNAVAIGILLLDILCADTSSILRAIDNIDSECTRGEFKRIGDLTFYDDTYSSSPEALIATFKFLSLYKPKAISCVLGDMLELGNESEALHTLIGHKFFEFGFDKLFTFGKHAEDIANGAESLGMNKDKIYRNSDVTAPQITARQIASACSKDEIILCKASHAVHAERIYDFIKIYNKN